MEKVRFGFNIQDFSLMLYPVLVRTTILLKHMPGNGLCHISAVWYIFSGQRVNTNLGICNDHRRYHGRGHWLMGTLRLASISLRAPEEPWILSVHSDASLCYWARVFGDFHKWVYLWEINKSNIFPLIFMLNVELSFTVFPLYCADLHIGRNLNFCKIWHIISIDPSATASRWKNTSMDELVQRTGGGYRGSVDNPPSAILLRTVYPMHTAAMQTAELGVWLILLCYLQRLGLCIQSHDCILFRRMTLSLAGLSFSAIVPNRYLAIFAPLLYLPASISLRLSCLALPPWIY